ncbi:MAG: Crp/Fnr family transcriptional regulator [Roseitalea porphyridii]|uniref:Crp/Fnr family transcriptional regulator n=1 Tax=Roseitalea porphyridii TaxID=1852022 RepID=UPI0032D963B3
MQTRGTPTRPPRLDESLLDGLAPFARLTLSERRQILDRATSCRFERSRAIFEEGAAAERFFLLLDGYVRVVRQSEDGNQVIMLHVPSGQLIGIAQAFDRDTYPATAVAASECVALAWPASFWKVLVEDYPGFAGAAMKTIGLRVKEFNERIVEMATLQVEQRIAHMVLRLVNQAGRKSADGIEIAMPVTRQDLSEMTGSTLHTVSRLLSAWEKKGWVKSGRRRIIVREPHQLVLLSEGRS